MMMIIFHFCFVLFYFILFSPRRCLNSQFNAAMLCYHNNSGVIIYDLAFEERCVNGWRNEMDTFWEASDQNMFLRVLGNYERYRCAVFALPQQYMTFANKRLMIDAWEVRHNLRHKVRKQRNPLVLPTFMHVTNYRVKKIKNATLHDEFVRYALDLKENETIADDLSWEDVVPADGKRKSSNGKRKYIKKRYNVTVRST